MGFLLLLGLGTAFLLCAVFCVFFLNSPKLSSLSVLFTFYKNESADEHKAM